MKISKHVTQALHDATIIANTLTLNGSLSRKAYTDTDQVLNALGGHWNKAAKQHVWPNKTNVTKLIADCLSSGEVEHLAKDFEYFPTPNSVVDLMLSKVRVSKSLKTALEPSAGQGAIALALQAKFKNLKVQCFEFAESNVEKLQALGFDNTRQGDFLQVKASPKFDLVCMNPPFSNRQDVKHVTHALGFLKPKIGQLLAITSAGVKTNTDSESTAFRDLIKSKGGVIEDLPANSFKDSGTGVSTCLIVVDLAAPKAWTDPHVKKLPTKVSTEPAKSLVEMIADMEESDRRIAEATQKLKTALASCLSPNEKAALEKLRPKDLANNVTSGDPVLQALEVTVGNISSLLASNHPLIYSQWLDLVEHALAVYKTGARTGVLTRPRTCHNLKIDRRLSKFWQTA